MGMLYKRLIRGCRAMECEERRDGWLSSLREHIRTLWCELRLQTKIPSFLDCRICVWGMDQLSILLYMTPLGQELTNVKAAASLGSLTRDSGRRAGPRAGQKEREGAEAELTGNRGMSKRNLERSRRLKSRIALPCLRSSRALNVLPSPTNRRPTSLSSPRSQLEPRGGSAHHELIHPDFVLSSACVRSRYTRDLLSDPLRSIPTLPHAIDLHPTLPSHPLFEYSIPQL